MAKTPKKKPVPGASETVGVYSAGNNAALATALALAGIPWNDDHEPARVEWDAELLAKSGCRTVSEANARRHLGRVSYNFASNPNTTAAEKAFNAANADITRRIAEGEAIDFLEGLPAAKRAEVVAIVLRTHKLITEAPYEAQKHKRYWIRDWGDGEIELVEKAGGKGGTIHCPSSKLYRADAPPELIAEMEAM